MNGGKIELIEDGHKKEYSLIFSFEQEGKNYLVYTDNAIDDDGFIKTYAGEYLKTEDEEKLLPIKDEKLLAKIENLLEKLDKEEGKE